MRKLINKIINGMSILILIMPSTIVLAENESIEESIVEETEEIMDENSFETDEHTDLETNEESDFEVIEENDSNITPQALLPIVHSSDALTINTPIYHTDTIIAGQIDRNILELELIGLNLGSLLNRVLNLLFDLLVEQTVELNVYYPDGTHSGPLMSRLDLQSNFSFTVDNLTPGTELVFSSSAIDLHIPLLLRVTLGFDQKTEVVENGRQIINYPQTIYFHTNLEELMNAPYIYRSDGLAHQFVIFDASDTTDWHLTAQISSTNPFGNALDRSIVYRKNNFDMPLSQVATSVLTPDDMYFDAMSNTYNLQWQADDGILIRFNANDIPPLPDQHNATIQWTLVDGP